MCRWPRWRAFRRCFFFFQTMKVTHCWTCDCVSRAAAGQWCSHDTCQSTSRTLVSGTICQDCFCRARASVCGGRTRVQRLTLKSIHNNKTSSFWDSKLWVTITELFKPSVHNVFLSNSNFNNAENHFTVVISEAWLNWLSNYKGCCCQVHISH